MSPSALLSGSVRGQGDSGAPDRVSDTRRTWLTLERQEYCFANLSADLSPGQPAVARGVPPRLTFPADIVRHVMAGQKPPSDSPSDGVPPPPDHGSGYTAISYLIGGMVVWGGIGWLVDHYWLGTKGIAMGVGAVIGGAAGVYLIARRLGA